MTFPDNCIRGIQNRGCLFEDDSAHVTLFEFRRGDRSNDGWKEASVNWMDDEKALHFTVTQTKEEGDLKFPIGAASLPLAELKIVKRRHPQFFDYERAPIEGNGYHGNLLLRADIQKARQALIRGVLAHIAEVHLYENIENQESVNRPKTG